MLCLSKKREGFFEHQIKAKKKNQSCILVAKGYSFAWSVFMLRSLLQFDRALMYTFLGQTSASAVFTSCLGLGVHPKPYMRGVAVAQVTSDE